MSNAIKMFLILVCITLTGCPSLRYKEADAVNLNVVSEYQRCATPYCGERDIREFRDRRRFLCNFPLASEFVLESAPLGLPLIPDLIYDVVQPGEASRAYVACMAKYGIRLKGRNE
jgi:hypothetical protein